MTLRSGLVLVLFTWLCCVCCRADDAVAAHHWTPERRPGGAQRALDAQLQGGRTPGAHNHVDERWRTRARHRAGAQSAASRGVPALPACQEGDRRRRLLVCGSQLCGRRHEPQRHALRGRWVSLNLGGNCPPISRNRESESFPEEVQSWTIHKSLILWKLLQHEYMLFIDIFNH